MRSLWELSENNLRYLLRTHSDYIICHNYDLITVKHCNVIPWPSQYSLYQQKYW